MNSYQTFAAISLLGTICACPTKTSSSQPTGAPRAPTGWSDETELTRGSADAPCDIGGMAALPALSSWAYTESKNSCEIKFLSPGKRPANWALGPIEDCGSLSEVGDLTTAPAGKTPRYLYALGALSVKKIVDESGVASFSSGTSNMLYQIDISAPGAARATDTSDTLRRALFQELQRWSKELDEKGLAIEQEKHALIVGGLAATPSGDFLLALRSPRVCPSNNEECSAIVFLVSDLAELFQKKPSVEIKASALLPLEGAGVASIEYEPLSEGFLVTSTKENTAFLLRYQGALTSLRTRPLSIQSTERLRAVVPAPGGAAAFFLSGEKSCKASWVPIPIEQLDGVDRTPPPE